MHAHYELFDHTADVGVRVYAPTLAELVEPAGAGLYAVIGELVAAGTPPTAAASPPLRLEFTSDDPALLLRDYLAELLRLFETHQQIAASLDVEEFTPARLVTTVYLRRVDLARSALEREAKAVTYHHLEIRPVPGGYQATFIVDI